MLNPFPIQFLAPLAYFLIRVILGFVCIRTGTLLLRGVGHSPKRKLVGSFFIGTGTAFIFGVSTQIVSLLTLFVVMIGGVRKSGIPYLSRTSLLLMATLSISLFITGAGPFAFDLPI